MFQIAVYGKGGIGKSTISANLSAALAKKGRKVLQVGCDPKHDSTRLLLGGGTEMTVLEYLRNVPPMERKLDDVLHFGSFQVGCVEAGGPEPGIGCAGRGILSTFDTLDKLGIKNMDFDIKVYDVLGDVVCGGFAVPLRREYADAIYLVTSGEFMSIYAANNILRGIRSFDGSSSRVAGLIFNQRGMENEFASVERFAKAVDIPIVVSVPRSEMFAIAEMQGHTIIETFPDTDLTQILQRLADHVISVSNDNRLLHPAKPLDDSALNDLAFGRVVNVRKEIAETVPRVRSPAKVKGIPYQSPRYLSQSVRKKDVIHGCAFAGAVVTAAQVEDAVTVMHGPRSCAHLASYCLDSCTIHSMTKNGGCASSPNGNLSNSEMDESVMIFGGLKQLEDAVRAKAEEGWRTIFIITTCPSGIIGDDVNSVIDKIYQEYPGIDLNVVMADGNISGDFSQGIADTVSQAINLIDENVEPVKGMVNIVGEKGLSSNTPLNFKVIESLLHDIGLEVNCRFLCRTDLDSIRNFKRGEINILANDDDTGTLIRDQLIDRLGVQFFDLPSPVGFQETVRWMEALGDRTGQSIKVSAMVEAWRKWYQKEVDMVRPSLQGRKVVIITGNPNVDWLIDLILDVGMDLKACISTNRLHEIKRSSRYSEQIVFQEGAPIDLPNIMASLEPDLILSNAPIPPEFDCRSDYIPFSPEIGYRSGIAMASRWGQLMRAPKVEGWRKEMFGYDR
jgi:nitrogenase iron protein NifH